MTDAVIDAFVKLMGSKIAKNTGALVEVLPSSMLETASMGFSDMYLQSATRDKLICLDLILVPALINRDHWVLFLVRLRERSIFLLDSLAGADLSRDRQEKLQVLIWLLNECHNHTFKSVPWKQWSNYYPQDLIRQTILNDCGMFVCLWAYTLSVKKNPPSKINAATSKRFRSFVARTLMAAGSVINQTHPPPPPSTDDAMKRVYKEYDDCVSRNELIVERPWLDAVVKLSQLSIPTMTALLAPFWTATGSKCGAPRCMTSGRNPPHMMQCEICREWFHQKCISDPTPAINGRMAIYAHSTGLVPRRQW